MAIGWMSALKVIPWGDVIEATPNIVKGARKIFARTQQAEAPVAHPAAATSADLPARVAQLESSLTQMAEQQKASARLIETLAEQNARIIEAVEILRMRSRLLTGACAVLLVALVGVAAWGVLR
jgi:hypothetical protein